MTCSIYRTLDILANGNWGNITYNETAKGTGCNKINMHFLNLILKCFSLNFAQARVSKQPNAQD